MLGGSRRTSRQSDLAPHRGLYHDTATFHSALQTYMRFGEPRVNDAPVRRGTEAGEVVGMSVSAVEPRSVSASAGPSDRRTTYSVTVIIATTA